VQAVELSNSRAVITLNTPYGVAELSFDIGKKIG
jgi:hypothetical protein